MKGTSKKVSWEITKRTFLPVLIFALVIVLYVLYQTRWSYLLSEQLQENLKKYLGAALIISITFIIQRAAGGAFSWYKENIASKAPTRMDNEIIPLLRRISNITIWIIAMLIILPLFGININALIAALGVSSLAIALAAQDTIANIIAGFMIMVDKPFRIGDKIKLPSGETVKVLDIGVRRSKFLSEDNKAIVIVPNLELSKSKIANYSYAEETR